MRLLFVKTALIGDVLRNLGGIGRPPGADETADAARELLV